ncbi:MAG: SRPBCC domain-containing protein [Deltaproteobacteria bacterium]|nr:SRPBCC domain-containing protein [Deltaproteobacteria bacterium]
MLKGLRTVAYRVADLERAKQWYEDLIGKAPYFDQPFYVGFDVGGYELGLQPAEEDEPSGPGGEVAYWGVDDVDAALARAVELGATVRQAARDVGEGIVVATVTDPFGNELGVIKNLQFAPPLVHAGAGDVADRAIVKEARVPLTPGEVFALWSSSEGMASWWASRSRIELRPGGFYEMYFMLDEPPGRRGGEGCRVLSFLPGRMLSFSWNAPPHLPRTRARHTWVVLEMIPDGEGCLLRLTHLGWPQSEWDEPESQWPETHAYFDDAWGRVMERFAAKHGG